MVLSSIMIHDMNFLSIYSENSDKTAQPQYTFLELLLTVVIYTK